MTAVRLLLVIPVALTAAAVHGLPWLSRRDRLFGVTVTEGFRASEGRALVRQYELRMLPWTIAAVAGSALLRLASHPFWRVALLLLLVVAAMGNLWRMFERMPRTAGGAERVRTAELSAGGGGGRWMLTLLAVPLAALTGTAVCLHIRWAEIPMRYPAHWNLQGVPNGWASRTAMDVYGPLAMGSALVLLIGILAALVRWGARRRAWNSAVMASLVVTTWMLGGIFTMVGLLPLRYFSPGQILGFEGVMLALLAVTIFIAVRRMREPGTPRGEATPDACWRGGIFYYNPQDPALMVEKRIGVGWTFNFANPLAWLIAALMVAVPVGIAILATKMTAR